MMTIIISSNMVMILVNIILVIVKVMMMMMIGLRLYRVEVEKHLEEESEVNKIRLKKSLKNVSIRRCKSIVNEFLKSLKPVSMRCYKSKAGEFLTPTNQCKHPESNDRKLVILNLLDRQLTN